MDAGGAVFLHEDSVATINYSVFTNNTANVDEEGGSSIGGAICALINSSLQIWNSRFNGYSTPIVERLYLDVDVW